MKSLKTRLLQAAALAVTWTVLVTPARPMDGYFLQGFGAVNTALGGAATAGNGEDLIGSIYKNPATAVLFTDRSASFTLGEIVPKAQIESAVNAVGLSGTSDSTITGVPYVSLMTSWKGTDPRLSWFAGAVTEAGVSFHAASSTSNPIFFPQSGASGNPFGGLFGGFGDVRTSLTLVRLPFGLAFAPSDRWSWGLAFAPTIGRNQITPAAFAAPSIGANGHPDYLTVPRQDLQLGFGAQAGLRYQASSDLSVGLSLSSPTWFPSFSWNAEDGAGASRTLTFRLDRPLTAQVGVNVAATASTHLLADIGYIAYGSTAGFAQSGFRPDGSIAGMGWQDAWTFELGVQQALSRHFVVRAGYNHCSDPISKEMTFFNVGSPLHLANHFSFGASVVLAPGLTVDLAYAQGLSDTQSGPWFNGAGAVPGTSVSSQVSGNEFSGGMTFKF